MVPDGLGGGLEKGKETNGSCYYNDSSTLSSTLSVSPPSMSLCLIKEITAEIVFNFNISKHHLLPDCNLKDLIQFALQHCGLDRIKKKSYKTITKS